MTHIVTLLPIEKTLKSSWAKVYGAKASIWAALGILFVIMFTLGLIEGATKAVLPNAGIAGLINFIGQIINFLLQMGLIYIGILRAYDLPFSYRSMFYTFRSRMGLRVVGLYLLQALIFFVIIFPVMLAIVFLYNPNSILTAIVAGLLAALGFVIVLYLSIRMLLAVGFVLDKVVNPWEGIKLSFKATRGNFWKLLGIFFIQLLIIIVSAIPLGIGLIWSLPFAFILYGMIYKNLAPNAGTVAVRTK